MSVEIKRTYFCDHENCNRREVASDFGYAPVGWVRVETKRPHVDHSEFADDGEVITATETFHFCGEDHFVAAVVDGLPGSVVDVG